MRSLWNSSSADAVAKVIVDVRDPVRFPWAVPGSTFRDPSPQELELAVSWTAGLLAAQRASTERRGESSMRQEASVDSVLASVAPPFTKVQPRSIRFVRDLEVGEYCRQSDVAGTRADLSIALRDGRLLLLECKVSNSEVNSYKRLIHEVGNKARLWHAAFGKQAVVGAVLAGAFTVDNLVKAQDDGIYLFWEMDLTSFSEFVESAH